MGETRALDPGLSLNQRKRRHQGVKCFAHSWVRVQFPTQSLVGTWARDQVTLFRTKCYGTKDRSDWLCGGDKG